MIPDAREVEMVQVETMPDETVPDETVQGVVGMPVAALRWEPCVEADATDELGLCVGCGWPVDDHDGAPETGREAVVIRVPEQLPLRRAS